MQRFWMHRTFKIKNPPFGGFFVITTLCNHLYTCGRISFCCRPISWYPFRPRIRSSDKSARTRCIPGYIVHPGTCTMQFRILGHNCWLPICPIRYSGFCTRHIALCVHLFRMGHLYNLGCTIQRHIRPNRPDYNPIPCNLYHFRHSTVVHRPHMHSTTDGIHNHIRVLCMFQMLALRNPIRVLHTPHLVPCIPECLTRICCHSDGIL